MEHEIMKKFAVNPPRPARYLPIFIALAIAAFAFGENLVGGWAAVLANSSAFLDYWYVLLFSGLVLLSAFLFYLNYIAKSELTLTNGGLTTKQILGKYREWKDFHGFYVDCPSIVFVTKEIEFERSGEYGAPIPTGNFVELKCRLGGEDCLAAKDCAREFLPELSKKDIERLYAKTPYANQVIKLSETTKSIVLAFVAMFIVGFSAWMFWVANYGPDKDAIEIPTMAMIGILLAALVAAFFGITLKRMKK